MIINIGPETFGGAVRVGDLVAVVNVIQFLRKTHHADIRFFMDHGSVNSSSHCQKFFEFLQKQTDCFSDVPGLNAPWNRINLWDFRDIAGDVVKIPNSLKTQKKVVVFPLFDAPYNTYRNWTLPVFEHILDRVRKDYSEHEKVICINHINTEMVPIDFSISTDYMENINHIMTADVYIGGDTGFSHFAAALDRGPKELVYYSSSRGLVHTLPFYLLKGKGEYRTYWLNLEGSTGINPNIFTTIY